MMSENEAIKVGHEAINFLQSKMSSTDGDSMGLVIGCMLGMVLDNLMDNISEEECFNFINEFHKYVDYLPYIYAIRAKQPKDQRRCI